MSTVRARWSVAAAALLLNAVAKFMDMGVLVHDGVPSSLATHLALLYNALIVVFMALVIATPLAWIPSEQKNYSIRFERMLPLVVIIVAVLVSASTLLSAADL